MGYNFPKSILLFKPSETYFSNNPHVAWSIILRSIFSFTGESNKKQVCKKLHFPFAISRNPDTHVLHSRAEN